MAKPIPVNLPEGPGSPEPNHRAAMNFEPVKTLEELDALSEGDIFDGYCAAERGDPEPGLNRGKAYWHGWCCRMRDFGELPPNPDHTKLVGAWVDRARERNQKK